MTWPSLRRRRVRDRNAPALSAPILGLLLGAGSACEERARPSPLPEPSLDGTRRFVGGSFGAPPPRDAGAGGAGVTEADASAAQAGAAASGAAGAPAEPSLAPVSQRETYAAVCGASSLVQWGFVTYEAHTPGDSVIAFRMRAAPSAAELGAASFIELIRASTGLGTARCALTGPAPDCPIDLYVRLGGAPLAHVPFLEVEAVLHPASADQRLPRVAAWRMDYSCTDAQ